VVDNAGGEPSSGAGFFAAGAERWLMSLPRSARSDDRPVDPAGKAESCRCRTKLQVPPFSPDGRQLALDIGSNQGEGDEIWRYDFATRGLSRVTFAVGSSLPEWSPDGQWLAYTGGMGGGDRLNSIFRKRIDGTGDEQRIWRGSDMTTVTDWSPDGRHLIVTDLPTGGAMGLYGASRRRLDTADRRRAGNQYAATIDPTGRFVAYTSTETAWTSSSRPSRRRRQVAGSPADRCRSGRDGRRIFFHDGAIHPSGRDRERFPRPGLVHLRGPYTSARRRSATTHRPGDGWRRRPAHDARAAPARDRVEGNRGDGP
jgi:hypothetical protein